MTDAQAKKLISDQHLREVEFMSDEKGYTNKEEENHGGKCGSNYNKGEEKNKKGWFNKNINKNNNKEWDVYRGVPDSAPCSKYGKNHTSGECFHNPFKKKADRNKNRYGKKQGFNGRKSYNGPHKNNNNQVSGEQYLGQLVAMMVLEEQQKS
eukprot:5170920-Ditylum_brightwellii.AAC.1